MNQIKIQKVMTQYGYEEYYWKVDGKVLPQYLDECVSKIDGEYLRNIGGTFDGLCPAWSKKLDFKGDVRFVWELIRRDNPTILPILLCPDDLDFSCLVIVVEVDKTKDFVYWNRVGYVLHDNEDVEKEKRSGILCLEAYSDKDWEKYGDNIALENITSDLWNEWISENWEEELYRRRINYTLPYYETEGNVYWLQDLNWCFAHSEYESMIQEFWERTTFEHLENILKQDNNKKLNVAECAVLIADMISGGRVVLQEHRNDYHEILLHLFAADMVPEPLLKLFDGCDKNNLMIDCYISLIEIMWKKGNEAVRNVVEVTILERLSDEDTLWQRFGELISSEFKCDINQEVLPTNLMMCGVKRLK